MKPRTIGILAELHCLQWAWSIVRSGLILRLVIYVPFAHGQSILAAPLGYDVRIDMPVDIRPATRWLTPNSVLTVVVNVTNNNVITGTQCSLGEYEVDLHENADTPAFSFVSPAVVWGPETTTFFTLTAPSFVTTTTFYAYATAYYTCTEGPLGIAQRGDSESVMVWNEIHQLYLPLALRY